MSFLESISIVHRRLCPENIYVCTGVDDIRIAGLGWHCCPVFFCIYVSICQF